VTVVATLFMGASSLALAVAFHAMHGMYLHAERLLARSNRSWGENASILMVKDDTDVAGIVGFDRFELVQSPNQIGGTTFKPEHPGTLRNACPAPLAAPLI
jgi:hypothetical protein